MNGSAAVLRYFALLLFVLAVMLPLTEALITCRYCIGEDACKNAPETCTGERCIKTFSPQNTVRRECINGSDPVYNFTTFKHTNDGEDAWICQDRDFCNAAADSGLSVAGLAPLMLLIVLPQGLFRFWL